MNIKRIMKQIVKEELTLGHYDGVFTPEEQSVLMNDLDKVAKVSLEDDSIEDFLRGEAEDLARVYLIRQSKTSS